MSRHVFRWWGAVLACGSVVAACSTGSGNPVGPNTVTANVSLSPAQYALYTGSQVAGRVRFPAAAAAAQYLVVGQFATATTDVSASIAVNVGAAPVASVAARPSQFQLENAPAGAPTVASQFHDMLRRREAELARQAQFLARPAAAPRAPAALDTLRTFKVCSSIACTYPSMVNVTAKRMYLGTHAAIYLDTTALTGGFSASDLTTLGTTFDQTLYPIDRNAFGAESDIDANGVVLILLTPRINLLVPAPQCSTSLVTGFFLGADIAPGSATSYNDGEVFYGMVPDPTSPAKWSCTYSVTYVRNTIPVTFIHEFQHMISFNQHVLARHGLSEVLWLNEAMSHLAEELGGLHFDSAGQAATASNFLVNGDFYNSYIYLRNPGANVLVTDSPPGGLESRGGEWLFLRYLVDQNGGNSATQQLEQTVNTGATNIAAVTGTPFPTLLGRWALAVYASDLDSVLAGFTAPPELTYHTWSYRHVYAGLHTQYPGAFQAAFPLVPAAGSASTGIAVGGTVTSGSGTYVLINQAAGAPAFDVTFLAPSGAQLPSRAGAQLAVLRTQ